MTCFAKQPPCLIGIEVCATAHCWGREFQSLGHDVRLIPPAYVKDYVICEAMGRPHMRFVPLKSYDHNIGFVATKS